MSWKGKNMGEITCKCCNRFDKKKYPRQHYCAACTHSGKARKFINRSNYYSDIERTRKIKNKYNRSQKGKAAKIRWYVK